MSWRLVCCSSWLMASRWRARSSAGPRRSFSSTDGEQLLGFLSQLAQWTENYGAPAFRNDHRFFLELLAAGIRRWNAMQGGWWASGLRKVADSAWRVRGYGGVVDAYSEMLSEVLTVPLSGPSSPDCGVPRTEPLAYNVNLGS